MKKILALLALFASTATHGQGTTLPYNPGASSGPIDPNSVLCNPTGVSAPAIPCTSLTLSGITTDGRSTISLTGTQTATQSLAAGVRDTTVYSPNGAVNVDMYQGLPHLGDAHGQNIANWEGFFIGAMTVDATYTGTTPAVIGFETCNQWFDNRPGGTAANPSPNFRCFLADPITNAVNDTLAGTVLNLQFYANGGAGGNAAASGVTVQNVNYRATLASGASTAIGGLTQNFGVYIQGDGGVNVAGSTVNRAIYSTSLARSEVDGGFDDTPIGLNSPAASAFTSVLSPLFRPSNSTNGSGLAGVAATFQGGAADSIGTSLLGGSAALKGGNGSGTTGTGGGAIVKGGAGGATSGDGGTTSITGGDATTSGNGGPVNIGGGALAGGGADGPVNIQTLIDGPVNIGIANPVKGSIAMKDPVSIQAGTLLSLASWSVGGLLLNGAAATVNDTTTGSGGVTTEAAYGFGATTITNTQGTANVLTNNVNAYFAIPVCGSGWASCTNLYSIMSAGVFRSVGQISGAGGLAVNGAVSINVNNSAAVNINTGTSAGAVNIANGSGNNTIGIGNGTGIVTGASPWVFSNASVKLTGIGTDATHTDATVCEDTTSHQLFFGSGTVGVCLGTSSRRYKHDINALEFGLAAIMALKPSTYYLNADQGDPSHEYYGFMAEDMVSVLPALVGLDAQGKPNTADYLGLVPVLVKGEQELKQRGDVITLGLQRQIYVLFGLVTLLMVGCGGLYFKVRTLEYRLAR